MSWVSPNGFFLKIFPEKLLYHYIVHGKRGLDWPSDKVELLLIRSEWQSNFVEIMGYINSKCTANKQTIGTHTI